MTIEIPDEAEYIRLLRKKLGLGPTEMANLLGINATGERTISGWENDEHTPIPAKWQNILDLENH